MAARKPLRAVAPGEKATPDRPLTVEEAIETGDERKVLVALRARAAKAVTDPNCPARDLAALTRRVQELTRDIEAIDAKAQQEAREDAQVADDGWDAEAL